MAIVNARLSKTSVNITENELEDMLAIVAKARKYDDAQDWDLVEIRSKAEHAAQFYIHLEKRHECNPDKYEIEVAHNRACNPGSSADPDEDPNAITQEERDRLAGGDTPEPQTEDKQ